MVRRRFYQTRCEKKCDERLECHKKLHEFLRTNHANDLLMPVKSGYKHPEYHHKGDTWSWSRYEALQTRYDGDVCVLLNQLCVVDIDDSGVAAEMVKRFPVLLEAPCECTAKGFHYWFTRPSVADDLGYFDGAGQREPKIDFKAVCSTGTSGVIVVAPSLNKKWIKTLWDTPVPEMPFDLLDAIASPRQTALEMTLKFCDGQLLQVNECGWMNHMTYFEPFLSDDISCTMHIPVPCTKLEFENLYYALRWNELSTCTNTPSRESFNQLHVTADKLGLSNNVMKRLVCGVPRFQLDMFEACPEWWMTLVAEKRWRLQGALDTSLLVTVDDLMARELVFEPLSCMKDRSMWLFPLSVQKVKSTHGKVLVRDISSIQSEFPQVVTELLQRYRTHLVLAGGAVLGAVSPSLVLRGNDYDLFIVGLSAQEATNMLNEIRVTYDDKICKSVVTGHAVTLLIDNNVIVQVILRLYENVAQVMVGFDLFPSKVGAYYDLEGNFTIKAAPSWIPAMRHMAFPVDTTCWGHATVVRLLKYKMKGFQVYLPGNRREALNDVRGENKKNGLIALFRAEYLLATTDRRRWFHKSTQELSMNDVNRCINKLKFKSDYSVVAKALGVLAYAVRAFVKSGRKFFYGDEKDTIVDMQYEFVSCDPRKACMAMFHPLNANVWEAYDMNALEKMLAF